MRAWIADIKEGQSAFDNVDDNKKPHRVVGGKIVINQRKNADKYTRQYWDKVGPCIHTRNDQMASQNTVHPCDDRVFSIRELMLMMTVPYTFKWVETDIDVLNSLSTEQKRAFLKNEEIKIRQSLGEAVPTVIFQSIAQKIKSALKHPPLNTVTINKLVSSNKLSEVDNLRDFIVNNPMNLSATTLGKIAELANTSRTDNAAFFTSKTLITEMMKSLPDTEKDILKEQKYLEEELRKSVARNEKVSGLYEKLYEDNASGKVTDEWFMQLSHKYEVERMELKAKIAELRKRIINIGTMQQNKENFINAIRRFMEMKKLTAPLLRELIDKITVYETEGVGKNRSQRVMIHYKFIGYIEIPECGKNYKADTRKGVTVEYVTKSA